MACRKHRVDLHVLVDYAPNIFTSDPKKFIDQVPEVDHLNLFLTGLGYVDQGVWFSALTLSRSDNPSEIRKKLQVYAIESVLSSRSGILHDTYKRSLQLTWSKPLQISKVPSTYCISFEVRTLEKGFSKTVILRGRLSYL